MSIQEHLNKIRNAVYGHEVRESIAKGIETAYDDASEKHDNANMEVKIARGTHPNLRSRLEEVDDYRDATGFSLEAIIRQFNLDPIPEPIYIENLWKADEVEAGLLSISSGNVSPNTSNMSSDFIPTETNAQYTFSHPPIPTGISFRWGFYDEGKSYISGHQGSSENFIDNQLTMTTPDNGAFIRISVSNALREQFVFNIGDEPLSEENEGDYWDGGFWKEVPSPPLRDGSVRENHLSPELWGIIESSGGSGDGGTGGDLGEQHIYDDSSIYSSGQEKVIADIDAKSEVDLIEFSSNGILSELQIFYKENDGTEFLYDLVSNNGAESVPNTFENMQTHGSSIVDFIEFDDRNNVFKVVARNLKFANGFKVTAKNNSDLNQNISVRVVSRQYV